MSITLLPDGRCSFRNRLIDTLFAFQYADNADATTFLCEIKFLDVPGDAPKAERYAWFLAGENVTQQLGFHKMETTARYFTDGSFLNMESLVYVDALGNSHALRQLRPI